MTDIQRRLPYSRQMIDEQDIAAVVDVLRSDFLTTGPVVDSFERAFAAAVNAPHAVSCANGTAALHIAALALDLGPQDFVIVPAITFLATANAARLVGAEVIFADVDPESGLMRAEDLEKAASEHKDKKISAVFPVHLAGQPAAPQAISRLASERGLRVVEDACHAIGTTYAAGTEKISVGSCADADMACFSFHPVKTIATGEGGMVTTKDSALCGRLKRLRSHGMVRQAGEMRHPEQAFDASGSLNPWYYEMLEVGLNYRLSDIHAALGLSQLGRLSRFILRRRELALRYDTLLKALAPAVRPIAKVQGADVGRHLYPVLIDFAGVGRSRSQVMAGLRNYGIDTQVHYIPVPWQPYYRARYGQANLPGAQRYYERTLSLPLYPAMSEDDVDRVVDALGKCIG